MKETRARECTECPLSDAIERRDFLRRAAIAAVTAVGAVALDATPAGAFPIVFATGTGPRADKAYPLPRADGAVIDKAESVIVARFDNRAYAFSLACPHQNTALRWESRGNQFRCPKHKSRYRPDGTFIDGRATRGLDRFAVRRDADRLMVNFDLLYREDEHAAEWAQAFVALAETTP